MLIPFELDPAIIHHVIYSQAGSIAKAIIELVMNSVDAQATRVQLVLTQKGFECSDDGKGFASRSDVIQYFGRFGTPHVEGDATFGRFRLGRGQIMAHAATTWKSNAWSMIVNPLTMGYSYDLRDSDVPMPGCEIVGTWHEPLTYEELMAALQEIRDLVRYTPITVVLNQHVITRNPRKEKWDAEDEFAYYRVKPEGAVGIYNQGVLVRHDSSHLWGAGGLIVSKQAIALNVSRTEILRKTCPVWRVVGKRFGAMATELASRQKGHRNTEAMREKAARSLLSGDPKALDIFCNDHLITLLPGKTHVSMKEFLDRCRHRGANQFAVLERASDVPRGEAIARAGIAVLVHPHTIERFGGTTALDFFDALERMHGNVRLAAESAGAYRSTVLHWPMPELLSFDILRDAFVEQRQLLEERTLDRETLRSWTAIKWCIRQYASICTGGEVASDGSARGGKDFHIVLGRSNTATAWTDGATYIAINTELVEKLKSDPTVVASQIFSVIEHEIAHEGDSIDAGHDEMFYIRFHELVQRHSAERQRYMHRFIVKYTKSLEKDGKVSKGRAFSSRHFIERCRTGRLRRGITDAADYCEELTAEDLQPDGTNADWIHRANATISSGNRPMPDWAEVLRRAKIDRAQIQAWRRELTEEELHLIALKEDCDNAELLEYEREQQHVRDHEQLLLSRAMAIIDASPDVVRGELFPCLHPEMSDEKILDTWQQILNGTWRDEEFEEFVNPGSGVDPTLELPDELQSFVRPGETMWTLQENARAAGFRSHVAYLKWRAADESIADCEVESSS